MFSSHARELTEIPVAAPLGGLNEAASIDTMGDTQAEEALNVEFVFATISKRRGMVQVGDQIDAAGAWSNARVCYWAYQYVKRDGTSTLLAVFGDKLYKLSGATWVGAISGANPGTAADTFGGGKNLGSAVQFNDVIYYADGDVVKRYDGTTIRNWSFAGGTHGAAVLGVAVPGGSLSAGAYTMVYTLRDPALGDETNPATASLPITAATNQKIPYTITKPAGYTTNYTRVRIYRTKADIGGAWFFEADVAASDWPTGGSADLTGFLTISDSSLGAEVAYDNDPAPKWRFLQLHDERVVGGNIAAAPSQVAWSKAGAPFSVPTANAQYLKRDDGHPIRAVFEALFGNLFVAKQGGPIFQLAPHPTLGYAPQQLPALHGCESHHSVVADDNAAAFVDRLGFVRFNGQQTELISGPVQRTFRTLAAKADTNATGETSLLQRCVGIHDQQSDRRQARWSFAKFNVSNESDDLLLIDVQTAVGEAGSWHREQYGNQGFRFFFAVQDPSASGNRTPAIYAANGNGKVFRLRTDTSNADVYADAGAAFTMKWHSKWFGDGINDFLPLFLDVEIEKSASGQTSGALSILVWKDGDTSAAVVTKSITLKDTGGKTFVVRVAIPVPSTGQYWKRLRFGFEHSAANGDVSIVKAILTAKMIGRRLQGVA